MFIRIRTINGKQYRYQEERWREGGKVRSRSVSLGPVNGDAPGFIRRQFNRSYGLDWDAIARQELARQKTDDEQRVDKLNALHAAYGLKLGPATPVPIDKPPTVVDLSASEASPAPAEQESEPEAAQENAPPAGEAEVQ